MTEEAKYTSATVLMWSGLALMTVALCFVTYLFNNPSGGEYGAVIIGVGVMVIGYAFILFLSLPAALYTKNAATRRQQLGTNCSSFARWLVIAYLFIPIFVFNKIF